MYRYKLWYPIRYKIVGEPKGMLDISRYSEGYQAFPSDYLGQIRKKGVDFEEVGGLIEKADEIVNLRFKFLQYASVSLSFPINWRVDPYQKKLWRYNLHYFDFAKDLSEAYIFTQNEIYRDLFIRLTEDWIDHNPYGITEGWERYTVAKRLINWMEAILVFDHDSLLISKHTKIFNAVWWHADFMMRNLEHDALFNHLLINGKALYMAGCLFPHFPHSSRFRQIGYDIIRRSLQKEVLADGGYAERSPGYHLLVLMDFFECMLLGDRCNLSFGKELKAIIEKMCEHLMGMLKPDLTLPMLNDTCLNFPMRADDFMAAAAVYFKREDFVSVANKKSPYALLQLGPQAIDEIQMIVEREPEFTSIPYHDTGYYVIRSGWNINDTYLVFDCGAIGPDKQLAHAHADTLSFELYSKGQTLIVDPGIYEYEAGKWRDYFRSTEAHNTVAVDSLNQSHMWKSFRVAEKANASLGLWKLDKNSIIMRGSHDGYQRLSDPVTHSREMKVICPDVIQISDILEAKGEHQIDVYFQLNTTRVQQIADHVFIAKYDDKLQLQIKTRHPQGTVSSIEPSWMSYHWGEKFPITKLRFTWKGVLPQIFITELLVKEEEKKT